MSLLTAATPPPSGDARGANPDKLRVEVVARGCACKAATVEVNYVLVRASALLWWDLFNEQLVIAFPREDTQEVDWDVDVNLCPCSVPLAESVAEVLPQR